MICSLCIGLSLVGTGSTAFGDGRAFTRDSNAECYRPAGRGVYSKDTNRTYLVYLNEGFLPWIRYYDHTKNVWSDAIRVSSDSGSSRQPDHLYPSMWIDIDGYLHVVYGAHGRAYRHSVSHKPEDPSSWRVMPTIGTDQCYPQPVWSSDNELYLFSAHYYRGMSKARRELGYFKSTDGGKTFGENKIIIEHAPDGSEYVGTIKHEPAHGENPEKFHIAWVFNGHDGHMYPVYYCWMDPGNLHLYNAAGDDLGTQITYEEWGACVAATPQLDKMQMQHIPNAYVTRNGDPFVIWLEEDNKQMCSHFSRYDADEGEWVTSQILSEPDTESRCTDIDVLDDGTICLYYPGGDWVKVVTSQDDGETWQADTIYESDRIGALYFASLIDSGEMGSHARRHPDFQLTFKQWHRSNRGGKHYQFAWGKKGFLGCPRREEKEGREQKGDRRATKRVEPR